jgi:hypothetical protein
MQKTILQSTVFTAIKLTDIAFITIIYFVLGMLGASLVDSILGDFDEEHAKKTPIWQTWLELFLQMSLLGICIYIARNVIRIIPFPLNGLYGFDHFRMKELDSEFIFAFPFIFFQNHFTKKLQHLYNRLRDQGTYGSPNPSLNKGVFDN